MPANCGATGSNFRKHALYLRDVTKDWDAGIRGNCVGLKIESYTNTMIKVEFAAITTQRLIITSSLRATSSISLSTVPWRLGQSPTPDHPVAAGPHRVGTKFPWKPWGTLTGRCAVATRSREPASRTTRSVLSALRS